jgi:hypothetical protein
MGGVNAAIEVGKHELKVRLGSQRELFSEPNQAGAINGTETSPRDGAPSEITRHRLSTRSEVPLA